ncbi:MAG: dihydroorotate dehydrogenase electron transfer subunit, partial [Thermoleophilaceae bacterium]|nr:dihydroorotate dehydrogenase electron transfer subunit [Thermoleophilaceae bacterium]
MLEAVGPGTERIARTAVGEELLISGPFGNGFSASEAPALLVGGGIGVAPLLALSDELRVEGAAPAAVLLGFRNAEYALAADLFDGAAEVATDDGSTGHHGLVTNL